MRESSGSGCRLLPHELYVFITVTKYLHVLRVPQSTPSKDGA
ncbi:unnamed protein product [Gulo gulo]|uniref:Uncharacterized protein n=1 Tax=Gulo gulo TaxID=48420 RepID=A0A9X9PT12_GULGU|nr:unnamed protein product [Gulo gulo]